MRRTRHFPWLTILFTTLSCSQSGIIVNETEIRQEISAVLTKQAEGWNEYDLEKYMQGYWNSDSLRFATGGRIQYGWQQTLEGYKKRYPDKEAIGHLTFSEINIDVLSRDAALVFGRWTLERVSDKPTGLFTLLFRKTTEGWRIVCDHTSSAQ